MQTAINKFVDYYQVLHFVSIQANSMVLHQNFVPDPENPNVKPPTALLASEGGISIQFTSGTIKDEDAERLRRMLFRVTRGKALVHFSASFTQDRVQRVVYLVVF